MTVIKDNDAFNEQENALSILNGAPYTPKPCFKLSEYIHSLINDGGTITEVTSNGEERAHEYSHLYERSRQLLTHLQKKGVKPSSRLVLLYDTADDYIVGLWACFFGGFTAVPWSFQSSDMEKETFSASFQQLLDSLKDFYVLHSSTADTPIEHILTEDTVSKKNLLDTASIPYYSETATPIETKPDSPCMFIATSGTTGTPKLAVISYATLVNRMLILFDTTNRNPNTQPLYLLPFNTVSALVLAFPHYNNTYYYNGRHLSLKPYEFVQFLQEKSIDHLSLTSHLAYVLARLISKLIDSIDLTYLKSIGFGADYIVPDRVNQLLIALKQSGLRKIHVSFGYGMTEIGLIALGTHPVDLEQKGYEVTNSILSTATKSMNIRIVDKTNQVLPKGELGEIQVKCPAKIFSGFYNQNPNFLIDGGWYATRDIGIITEQGLDIKGRTASLIQHIQGIQTFEQIENKLHGIKGIQNNLVFASEIEEKAELLVFFVTKQRNISTLNNIRLELQARLTDYQGRLRLVPINSTEIPTTRTSKIHRAELKKLYIEQRLQGNLGANNIAEPKTKKIIHKEHLDEDIYKAVLRIWMQELDQKAQPDIHQNLFEMGGDSLDFVIILSEVEKYFSIKLDAELFYKEPSINALCKMIMDTTSPQQPDVTSKQNFVANDTLSYLKEHESQYTATEEVKAELFHTLSSFLLSWPGHKQKPDSLLRGTNINGSKPPIFWVFQGAHEFTNLGKALGEDQPLYGMRSLVKTPFARYSKEIVSVLASLYLSEVLTILKHHSKYTNALMTTPIIGGNCQAGIIALSLARKLCEIDNIPSKLVLLEWGVNTHIYKHETLLLYGESSYTADTFQGQNSRNINWRQAFPINTVASLPCSHGQFFLSCNIKVLSKHLQQQPLLRTKKVSNQKGVRTKKVSGLES